MFAFAYRIPLTDGESLIQLLAVSLLESVRKVCTALWHTFWQPMCICEGGICTLVPKISFRKMFTLCDLENVN
jgi:hypothetical protein